MIAFTAPWALIGLLAAALPVLLHLVQRREPPEVAFPAVRYLEDATRDHRRRLKLRNLLLLIVRTLLVIVLVLAAAGLTVARSGIGDHQPSALVLVIDNSASSAAVRDGEMTLTGLVTAAGGVLARATAADRLWLVTADGLARSGTRGDLAARLAALVPEPVRLDLGAAVAQGRDLLHGSGRRGEVVVVTDLQRSAVTETRGEGAVLVIRPASPPSGNRRVASIETGTQPWGADGGRVGITVTGPDTSPMPVTIAIGARMLREILVAPGAAVSQRVPPIAPGWSVVRVTLSPDEFRLDDTARAVIRVAPPVPVRWSADDHWVDAALDVLAAEGRVRNGDGVRVGGLGSGASIVMPPADPALTGALNRALAARGAAWQYGSPVLQDARTDSTSVLPSREGVSRRVALEPMGAESQVLVRVDGAPWLVRTGDVLMLGSRMEPDWTGLPLAAAFVPFVDALVTRASREAPVILSVAAGDPVVLPDHVTGVHREGVTTRVEGGARWRPIEAGIHYLVSGADTIGAVVTHVDPRESELARATDRDVRSLWRGALVEDLDRGPRIAFTAGGRGDLRTWLLIAAVLLALTESALAGRVHQRS